MRKFDSKNLSMQIFQKEHYFDLHEVASLQKINIASIFVEQGQHVWYQWLCKRKKDFVVSSPIFIKEFIAHYGC